MAAHTPVPTGASVHQRGVRENNLRMILRRVSTHGAATRAQLAAATGLTKATVSSLVAELTQAGLLTELGVRANGGAGRPGSVLDMGGGSHASIGLEVNVDYLAACVSDLGHRIRYHRVECADNRGAPRAVLDRLSRVLGQALNAAREAELQPVGIALALPGLVDVAEGHLLHAPNLDWSDLPIADMLAERLDLRPEMIRVENEANLAALGELSFGGGGDWGDFVQISGEIGVGAGIITEGRMDRGSRGFAGEIGHISVDPHGEPCGCGGRGCLERYCGLEAMLRGAGLSPAELTTSIGDPTGPISQLVAALQREEPQALEAVGRAADHLGVGMANVVNTVDPDTVVLGGVFAPLAPWLVDRFTDALHRQTIAARWSPPRVAVSVLGSDAAVRGAAGLGIEAVMNDPARVTRLRAEDTPVLVI
ncbi:ROK family protein [Nocardiopsis salina]|uniref:ROK family protein n=1 Tax=Nocardiopsis salina TaxID=245836 RepID=UPI00037AD6A5|nr:ROK family protein [Nocardiopsis salina]